MIPNSSHLFRLESEAIDVMRVAVSESENPVMLYSVGKDSAVMLHLAKKAFYPSSPPFPLMHVDTTWKFQEMYKLRDKAAWDAGMELIVHQNLEAKERRINPFDHGALHTDMWKTEGLKQALDKHGFDAAFGGARRDEENRAPRNVCFPSAPFNIDGSPRRSAQSFGHSIMRVRLRAKASEFFHCQIGRNWTSGSISSWKG